MDELWIALGKIGGVAVLGVLIDLALRKREKDRIAHWMTTWWDRFDSLKWTNFGKAEALFAIALIDRCAGKSLWSRKRWLLTAKVTLFAFVVSNLWIGGLSFIQYARGIDAPYGRSSTDQFVEVYSSLFVWAGIAGWSVLFAISLSFTRAIAILSARLSTGPLATAITFSLLLCVHVVLLLYWSDFAGLLVVAPLLSVSGTLTKGSFLGDMVSSVSNLWDNLPTLPESRINDLELLWTLPRGFGVLAALSVLFKTILDIIANGLRILLALAFLSSFVFGPFLQPLLSRLWAGVIESGKATFTTLFGIVGAIIVLVQACDAPPPSSKSAPPATTIQKEKAAG